jgi:thiamine kinase-like enzyme
MPVACDRWRTQTAGTSLNYDYRSQCTESDFRTKAYAKEQIERLHAAGWHHHDLWEGNVIGDERGQLWLIDFEAVAKVSSGDVCPNCTDEQFLTQYCN